jgi:hypothetical protein
MSAVLFDCCLHAILPAGKFSRQHQRQKRTGDSIIKEKSIMDIRVIRESEDTVFTIDYGCEKYP